MNVLGMRSLTVVTVPPGVSCVPFAVTPSIEVPMAPSLQPLALPASRTESIQRPLLLGAGFASSGEMAQTDGTMAASVTFSSLRICWEGRWKLDA